MNKKINNSYQRRRITISVCHPVTARVTVYRPDNDSDWMIESVDGVNCAATTRSLAENMRDEDFDEMIRRADAAKDLEP